MWDEVAANPHFCRSGMTAVYAPRRACGPSSGPSTRTKALPEGSSRGPLYAATATYVAVTRDGSGTGCPLSRRPSMRRAIASRISRSHSSSVAPVAAQPGRSGAYALETLLLVTSTLRRGCTRPSPLRALLSCQATSVSATPDCSWQANATVRSGAVATIASAWAAAAAQPVRRRRRRSLRTRALRL